MASRAIASKLSRVKQLVVLRVIGFITVNNPSGRTPDPRQDRAYDAVAAALRVQATAAVEGLATGRVGAGRERGLSGM